MDNKKEPDVEFEKAVMEIINKYVPILFLQRYTFELKNELENDGSTMECKFNYPYLNATFNYGEKIVKMWKEKKDIVPYVIHEMCHLITDPLYCKATNRWSTHDEVKDERELLTDYICNIVVKNKL